MSMDAILDFLTLLEQNNNREWFHANEGAYRAANREFEELVGVLMLELHRMDGTVLLTEPKQLTFKLQRDTRFSHDKSPYNPCFRAHISARGKLPIPVGYYLQIRPEGRSFLGGGLFADMFTQATAMVRDYLAGHGEEWERIISSRDFTEHFTVGGTALKNVPRGYDAAHPQAEYLKHKSWFLEYSLPDDQLLHPDFIAHATEIFAKMQPFNTFLNRALDGFQMPQR